MQKLKDVAAAAVFVLLFPCVVLLFSGKEVSFRKVSEKDGALEGYYIRKEHGAASETLDLKSYTLGAAAAVLWADCEEEMMKAQMVLVRTNLLRKIQEAGEDHTISEAQLSEVYMEPELQRRKFGSAFEAFWERLTKAGEDTDGWILTFEGEPVEAAYHLVSSGRTRMGSEVLDGEYPYLQPVECAEDRYAKDYLMRKEISGEEWRTTLEAAGYDPDAELQIAVRDASGYVCRIKLGEQVLGGEEFRRLFDLNSADFFIEEGGLGKIITTKGVGHGLGMSQYGANVYAENGADFREILARFFPGTELKKIE